MLENISGDAAVQKASVIRSWTQIEERECLARLAREVPVGGLIVELGCLYGGMSAVMALANPSATVYSIDDFSWAPDGPCNEGVVRKNMLELGIANHICHVGDSTEIGKTWDRPIDLLLIDGGHRTFHVRPDLSLFGQHASVIALHDYLEPLCPEVKPVVDEYVKESQGLWQIMETVVSVAVLRKTVEGRRLAELRTSLSEQIANLDHALSRREADIAEVRKGLSKRDRQLSDLHETLRDRDIQIAALRNAISQRADQLTVLNIALSNRDSQITSLTQLASRLERQIADLNQAMERMGSIRLRKWLGGLLRRSLAALARLMPLESESTYRGLRFVYRHLPGRLERKMPWAQHLLSDVPKLQGVAFRIAQKDMLLPSADLFDDRKQLDAQLLPQSRRVLVVEQRVPMPDSNSSSVRLYSILKIMTELNWEITFVSNTIRPDYHFILPEMERGLSRYERLMSTLGINCIYGMGPLIEHLMREGETYGLAFLSYPEIMYSYAPVVRAYMPNAALVYDTVDLHGIRFAREALAKNNDAGILEKARFYTQMELANAESADVVIAVTDVERQELLEHVPAASVEIIANIHSIPAKVPALQQRDGLLFIGHYLHSPNEDAVLYFLNDVLPLIHQQLNGIPFYVLGSSMPRALRQFESSSIHMIGYVEDPVPWFARARVFVAPLRYGAGIKGKVGMSLSLGLPVVTTSIGAEGMHLEDGKHVLIADSPLDFAAAVIKLYKDSALWATLAENGRSHVAQNFSAAVARETLSKLLQPDKESATRSGGL